jgi:hypothetical protein
VTQVAGAGMSNYEDSQQMYGQDEEQAQIENELAQEQQMRLMVLDEELTGPQAVRYDQIYYPRTDKRSISK